MSSDRRSMMYMANALGMAAAAVIPLSATAQQAKGDTENEPRLETVTVTARLREESIREIPGAVTAVTSEQLEVKRIEQPVDLIGRTPSLFSAQGQSLGPNSNQTFLVMRGVGATVSTEPSTAVFIDGIYAPSRAFDTNFVDLEQVELLRGPQGALFGRNTQGGALSLTTRKPNEETRIKLQTEVDDLNTVALRGSVSGELAEGAYGGASVEYVNADGFIDNITLGGNHDDYDMISGRGTLVFDLTSSAKLQLVGYASERDGGTAGWGVPDDDSERYISTENLEDAFQRIETVGGSARLDWEWDFADFTGLFGYSDIQTRTRYDHDGGTAVGNLQDQTVNQTFTSLELRLASNGDGPISWLGGVYIYEQEDEGFREFLFPDGTGTFFPLLFNDTSFVDESYQQDRSGIAVFGQVIWDFAPQWELAGGLRISDEKVDATQRGAVVLTGIGVNDVFAGDFSQSFDDVSPSVSLSYMPSSDLLLYGTISRGFKGGGFDFYPGSTGSIGLPFDAETSTNYEAGSKSTLFGGTTTLDVTAFYIDIKDQQIQSQRTGSNNLPVVAIDNVGSATSQGVEVEFTTTPIDPLDISGGFSYIDTEFGDLTSPSGADRTGDPFPYVPEWTAFADVTYTNADAFAGYDLVWHGAIRYVGDYTTGNNEPPFDPSFGVDDYTIVDASVGLENAHWELTLFVDNLFDEFAITRRFSPPFQLFTRAQVLPPQTVGLRLTWQH